MNTYSMLFTSEELPVMRDALIEEYQRLKAWQKERGTEASENLNKRVAMLEGLKDTFKQKCLHSR